VHAIVPLSILEAIQRLDAPTEDGLEEFHRELAIKRLGLSETVAVQVERFRQLAGRGRRVEAEEVAALFKLAGRRSDAGLVFAGAGRSAGRGALRLAGGAGAIRTLPRFARRRLGFAVARRAAHVFEASLSRIDGLPVATMHEPPSALSTPGGVGCGFYGSAIAEILRALTDFDGAMFHVRCRSRGDEDCRWSTREA
jgi:hypothetical protein